MKLSRLTLPKPMHVGALGQMVEHIDTVSRHLGTEIIYDPRSGVTSIFKGEKVSILLPSGAMGDLAEDQGEDDDAGTAGGASARVAGSQTPRRGRPPKNPPPVQT